MAEKRTIELEIKENFKQVEKDLNSLDKALDNTANSARDVNRSFEDVYGDLQPLTTRMGEAEDRLYELAAAGDYTSNEYKNLLNTVGEYRKVQINTDLAVDAASMTLSQKLGGALGGVASGFELAQGSMALFGVEGENVQAALLKVQSAMALSQGLQGLKEAKTSFIALGDDAKKTALGQRLLTAATAAYNFVTTATTKGLKLFRIALISTGVGALIVGVGLLVANFDKLLNVFTPVIDGLKNIGDAIGLTDFAGKERAKNESQRYAEEAKRIQKIKEAKENAFNKEQKAIDRLIAVRSAEGKSVDALTKQKVSGSIAYQKELQKELQATLDALEVNILQFDQSTKSGKFFANVLQEKIDIVKAKNKEAINSILDSENELKIIDINAKKDAVDRNKSFSDKQRELNRQIEKERIDAMEDGMEKRLALLKFNEEGELSAIIGKGKKEGELRTSIETRYEKERNKVKEEFRVRRDRDEDVSLEKRPVKRLEIGKQEIDAESFVQSELLRLEQEADDKRKANTIQRTDLILKYAKTFTDVYSSLNGLLNASDNERLKKVEKGSKEEQKIKKRMFNRDKALRISQTIVDTASNIVTSVRNGGGIPTGIPFGIAAGAMGALQIAAITKAKYDGGETPSASGGGDVASGGGASTTPQFNTIGSSGVNQLAQLQQQPVQAYVVSGEVTSAQSLDRNRIQNATL